MDRYVRKILLVAVVVGTTLTGSVVAVARLDPGEPGGPPVRISPRPLPSPPAEPEPTQTTTPPHAPEKPEDPVPAESPSQPAPPAPQPTGTTGPGSGSADPVAPVEGPGSSPPQGGTAPGHPGPGEEPTDPGPGPIDPGTGDAEVVSPRPGMENVHPSAWFSYELLDPGTVRVYFYAGVEPCSVLDSVRVEYSPSSVGIGLFVGSDPAARDMACIMIAQLKATDIRLEEALSGRQVIDLHR